MAEMQTNTESGEMTQRFIEFVMMQAQNAALFLGQIPNPQSGKAEVNLDVAKMFIDQLAMIRVKTRGNLSSDEQAVLNNAITNLQMAFFETSQGKGAAPDDAPVESLPPETATTDAGESAPPPPPPAAAPEGESKKKFTKSYGA